MVTRRVSEGFGVSLLENALVFGNPKRESVSEGPRRNSANASIVSQRLHNQRHFYLRPKFRQLQRLLGPAYTKIATPKFVRP